MSLVIETGPVSATLYALASTGVAPSTGVPSWAIALVVVAGLAAAGWLVHRNLAGREQLERELELLLPGTRVGAGDFPAEASLPGSGDPASPRLRELAREWIARDPERAALLLAAWANEAGQAGPEGRNAA